VAKTRHDYAGGKSAGPQRGPQAKMRACERLAAERAARKRAEARRRLLAPIVAVTAVLAIVVALVAVKLTSTPAHLVASESTASSVVVKQVSTVPASVLAKVSPGQAANGFTPLETVTTSGPPLTIGGKPAIVFVSEESCPFCAAERWSVAVALSHFGTLSHLGTTSPPYVNSADQSGAVPFLDIANKYVLAGAQYNPQVLAGLSAAQIASQLSSPASPVARAVDGSAQAIIAAIDQVLHTQTARS
jgi:Domain of unknown function (DUF929)